MSSSQLFEPQFRVERLGADGTKYGMLQAVTRVTTSERLDQAIDLSFTIPAGDEQAAEITAGSYFDVYDRLDGYIGQFVFRSSSVTDQQGVAMLTVQCFSTLIELGRTNVGFNRVYSYHTVEEIANDLVEIHPSWTCEAEATGDYGSVDYSGESILAAVNALREKFRLHFRHKQGFARRLEFGNLGTDTAVRLSNVEGAPQYLFGVASHIGIVSRCQKQTIGEEIVNRVIALGSGQGAAQLTMEKADYIGSYTLQSATNPDGSLYYYIEDATSVAEYGLREYVIVFEDVRAVSNSDTAITNGANQLKVSAEAYLQKYKDPKEVYAVTCDYVPTELQIGDQVRLDYRGTTDGINYLDVNEDFYVLEIRKSRQVDGSRSISLVISDTLEAAIDDTQLVADTIRRAEVSRLHIQTFPGWINGYGWDYAIANASGAITERRAQYRLQYDDLMTDVLKVNLNFRTRAMEAYGSSYWTGANVANIFGWRGSDTFPGSIRLYINSVDVTDDLGGPWNPYGASFVEDSVSVDVDISDYIINATGGFRQEHLIEVEFGQRDDFDVSWDQDDSFIRHDYAHGSVEFGVSSLVITQAFIAS